VQRIAQANAQAAAAFLSGRSRVVGIISRALVDATAGEEIVPHHETAPGHDLDVGGGQS
jgi:hypothetical protein